MLLSLQGVERLNKPTTAVRIHQKAVWKAKDGKKHFVVKYQALYLL